MLSTFFGLELSRRALEAQQNALDITGHNIANANTPGYTRQLPSLKATTPGVIPGLGHSLSLGTGVTLDYIQRARDNFVDRQYRWESSKQQYWGARQDSLQKIEGLMNEPSDNSLHDDMDKFWNAWSDMSKNPENMGARSVVRERALALTDSFHHIAQQITDMKKDLDANVRVQIHQVNVYAQQLQDLNAQIKRAEVAGDNPNDLRDQRDALIDELSKIVSVRVNQDKDPAFTDREVTKYTVMIGNEETTPPQVLVDDTTLHLLNEPPPPSSNGLPFATVTWADTGATLDLGSKMGSIQANMEVRGDIDGANGYLSSLASQFDTLAKGIADAVNALHQKGQGLTAVSGLDFFTTLDGSTGVNAANIGINPDLETDLGKIATGAVPADGSVNVGDGSVAQAISSLSGGWAALDAIPMAATVPAASFGDYYGANIAQMGVDVQQANRMKAGQDVLVTHLSNQRESYSGVSLDEEMTNLVKFQKTYAAAARMVTMMDDMLDTIVNRMGMTR
ncbi:MAG: flagellar hook-associated protein FlgK [Desulfitobacteriaceae bacterium]|nr:flagellar hook-associated protein FlgK [Desulfitobacteriaceae bacterium]MDI6879468.1 flagellar hook-associated protein FlgK [Desulfitobacteriaceae bacterium]MDI6912939.1 flagellar hook-associated protein FlgK [Desulfitobacteriaceae bacterium]